MTKILCDMTGCKYNDSCCLSSAQNNYYCTKDEVHFSVNEESCQIECMQFTEAMDKEVECTSCQIKKYGGIRLPKKIHFEQKDVDKFTF